MPAHRLVLPAHLVAEPFSAREASAAGLSRSALRSRTIRRIAPRVYCGNLDPTLVDQVRAHLMTLPRDVIVEGVTALQLYGIDLGPVRPLKFCSCAGRDIRRQGIAVRRPRTAPPHRGRLVTPIGALLGAAADLDLVELVVAGDWLLRARLSTLPEVRSALAASDGPYGRRRRRAAELVRTRVESPPESRLRLLLVLAGLPEPECNVDVGNEHFFIARVDLLYRRWKIVLEYEGDQHRTERQQWLRDIDRAEWLGDEGYLVLAGDRGADAAAEGPRPGGVRGAGSRRIRRSATQLLGGLAPLVREWELHACFTTMKIALSSHPRRSAGVLPAHPQLVAALGVGEVVDPERLAVRTIAGPQQRTTASGPPRSPAGRSTRWSPRSPS